MSRYRVLTKRIILIPLLLSLSACATSQTGRNEGARFTSAAIMYVDALPAVLDESFELAVRANSHQLMLSRNLLTEDERAERLEQSDALITERLDLLRKLNSHALLVRSYFLSFRALSSAENANAISMSAQDVANRMTRLSPVIADARVGDVKISGLIGPAARMVVGSYQNAALDAELRARGSMIERELALQKAVMALLVDQMKDDARLIVQIEKLNPVFEEYVYESEVSEQWGKKRIVAFRQAGGFQSLDSLNRAADNLHGAWVALVEKRLAGETMGLLVQDTEQMLAVAREFRAND